MAKLRKLGRRTDHRSAMLRNQVASLFKNGRIQTTYTRAKETQRLAEKMITLAKHGDLASKRAISSFLYENAVARKLVEEIAPNFANRNGGYTRVLRVGPRRGDAAEIAILELVESEVKAKPSHSENKAVAEDVKEDADSPVAEAVEEDASEANAE